MACSKLSGVVSAFLLLTALVAAQAQAGTVTFIHLNDLHAHLTPHLDKVEKDGALVYEMRGGLARIAGLIKLIRAENPDSVLMNIGDTFHGGVEALFSNGNAIVDPVNALGVDVGVPGNWDYAYGPAVTRLRYADLTASEKRLLEASAGQTIKRPNFPVLAANVSFTQPPSKAGKPFLPPTWLKTVGGIRIGFIGVSSDIVPNMDERLATGLSFLKGEDAYRDLINGLANQLRQQGANLVVVMSELGLQKDYRLADVVDKGAVDIFFSAHTHETVFTPLIGKSGARVVEAGNDGWLGRMDVTLAAGGAPHFKWTLLPVGDGIAEDPAVASLVQAARAPFLEPTPNLSVNMEGVTLKLTQPINQVLGYRSTPLDRKHALESTFNDAWTDALRQKAGSDLALTPGFRMDAPIPAAGTQYEDTHVADGALTVEDVYRYFPVPYTMAAGNTSGANVRAIIEGNLTAVYSHDAFMQGGGWTDGWSGLAATVDLSQPDGSRVLSLLQSSGKPVADSDTLSVAGCQRPMEAAGILCSYSGFDNVTPIVNPLTGNPYYVQELFSESLVSGRLSSGMRQGMVDVSGLAAWPASSFIQPVYGATTSASRVVGGGAADVAFNYLEAQYPRQLSPGGGASDTYRGYYYRYYPASRSYLGVLDNTLYYIGPLSKDEAVSLGPVSDWLATASTTK